jgi:hypothetical protein
LKKKEVYLWGDTRGRMAKALSWGRMAKACKEGSDAGAINFQS